MEFLPCEKKLAFTKLHYSQKHLLKGFQCLKNASNRVNWFRVPYSFQYLSRFKASKRTKGHFPIVNWNFTNREIFLLDPKNWESGNPSLQSLPHMCEFLGFEGSLLDAKRKASNFKHNFLFTFPSMQEMTTCHCMYKSRREVSILRPSI